MARHSGTVHPLPLAASFRDGCRIVDLRPGRQLRVYQSNVLQLESNAGMYDQMPAKALVIFLIHGVSGSIEVWNSQICFLREFGSVGNIIAFDCIGHGQSYVADDPDAYSFHELELDVVSLFQTYRGEENIIIGHSYGCCFATLLAHNYGHLVSKLILISGGSPLALAPEPGCLALPNCFLSCLRSTLCSQLRRKLFYRQDSSRASEIIIPPTTVLKWMMMGQIWPEGDIEFHAAINVGGTLLIHGRNDALVTLAEMELMHETIKNSQMEVIDEAGHMVMMEQPDAVNSLIGEFLFGFHTS